MDTLLQQSGDGEKRREECLNLTFCISRFSEWGGEIGARGEGRTEVGGRCGYKSPLLLLLTPHIKERSCPHYLPCTFWWSTTLWTKSAGMDRGWVDAAAWQGVCETAVSSSPPWSPSCRAVVWAIAGEQSFHMWVCGSDPDLSHRIDCIFHWGNKEQWSLQFPACVHRLIVSGWIIQRIFGRCFHACTTLLKMSVVLESTGLKSQGMFASFFSRSWSL